jgi:hypothetical protein
MEAKGVSYAYQKVRRTALITCDVFWPLVPMRIKTKLPFFHLYTVCIHLYTVCIHLYTRMHAYMQPLDQTMHKWRIPLGYTCNACIPCSHWPDSCSCICRAQDTAASLAGSYDQEILWQIFAYWIYLFLD